MKKLFVLILILSLSVYFVGCASAPNMTDEEILNRAVEILEDNPDANPNLILTSEVLSVLENIDVDTIMDEALEEIEVDESVVEKSSNTSKDTLSIGDTFIYDSLEISLLGVKVKPVDNRYSDYEDAVLLDVKITNLSTENHGLNMFDYMVFGSNGTEISSTLDSYFDEAEDTTNEMRPGASIEGSLAFEYDGDGEYFIVFDDWFDEAVEASFDVVK